MKTILHLRFIIILICMVDAPLYAQRQAEVDSILNLLKKLPEDSSKVLAYDRLAYMYNFVQYKTELARQYVDSALSLSEKLNYKSGILSSHYSYGMIDMNEANYNEALEHFNQYIHYYTKAGDSTRVAK